MIKSIFNKYIWNWAERPAKIGMWTLVGIGMIVISYQQFYTPQKADAGSQTPLQEATYREWVDARAEWLQTTDDWKEYAEEEARSIVNTRARSAAQVDAEVYKIMTEERIATSTKSN